MILGSFVLFFCAFLLPIPPLAFSVWLVSAVMFFAGLSSRGTRKAVHKQTAAISKASAQAPDLNLYRECPSCKEHMRRDASVCPHCRRESPAWRFHEGRWWTQKAETQEWFWLDTKSNTWVRAEE